MLDGTSGMSKLNGHKSVSASFLTGKRDLQSHAEIMCVAVNVSGGEGVSREQNGPGSPGSSVTRDANPGEDLYARRCQGVS